MIQPRLRIGLTRRRHACVSGCRHPQPREHAMLKSTFAAAALAAAFAVHAHDGCDDPAGGRPVIHTTELLLDLDSDQLTMQALERLEDLGRKLALTDVETVIAIAHA